jgi:hypothetical protein
MASYSPGTPGASCRYPLKWVRADVIGLLSFNVGRLSVQCGPGHPMLSANVVPKRPMLSGPRLDVIGPLQLLGITKEANSSLIATVISFTARKVERPAPGSKYN